MVNDLLRPDLVAPCGMNCALCLAYRRKKDRCLGCRGDDAGMPKTCRQCIIRNCETIRTNPSHFCYDYKKMPCRRLKQLDARYRTKYGMSMLANLEEIRDSGMDAFLEHQSEKYTCKTCHGLICVHRARCLDCHPKP